MPIVYVARPKGISRLRVEIYKEMKLNILYRCSFTNHVDQYLDLSMLIISKGKGIILSAVLVFICAKTF